MSLIAIAKIVKGNSDNIIKLRVLDTDKKKFKDIDCEQVVDAVVSNRDKYKDSNLYAIKHKNDIYYLKYIYSYIPDIEIDSVLEDDYWYVFKKSDKYNRYLMTDMVGNIQEVVDVEASMYNTCNVQYDTNRHIIFVEGLIADKRKHKGTEREREIKEEYDKFIAKTKLLGMDNSFEYIVDGEDVIFAEYTGLSDKVIIPNFITIIGSYAFPNFDYANLEREYDEELNVKEIVLNKGLKKICYNAFYGLQIKEIVIPETVELIEKSAFVECKVNVYNNGERTLKKECIKLLNPNTIVEDFEI